jgi:hypothetical protein
MVLHVLCHIPEFSLGMGNAINGLAVQGDKNIKPEREKYQKCNKNAPKGNRCASLW